MRRSLLYSGLLTCLLLLLTATPPTTKAQDAISNVSQSQEYTFGQLLHFAISAQATTVFTEARLVINVAGRPDSIIVTPDIERSANLQLGHDLNMPSSGIAPFSEITYHWELVTLGGAALTSDAITFRYEDNLVPWQWRTRRAEQFVVHWDGEDVAVAQIALDVAGEALERSNALLDNTNRDDIHIYIYSDLSQFEYQPATAQSRHSGLGNRHCHTRPISNFGSRPQRPAIAG